MFRMKISVNNVDLYDLIDSVADRHSLQKVGQGVYIGTGSQQDFARFGKFIFDLKGKDGFLQSVDEWLFYEGEQVQDVAEHYRKKGIMGARELYHFTLRKEVLEETAQDVFNELMVFMCKYNLSEDDDTVYGDLFWELSRFKHGINRNKNNDDARLDEITEQVKAYRQQVREMIKSYDRSVVMSEERKYLIGEIRIDGIEPSKEFLEIVEKEKSGEITTEEAGRLLAREHRVKNERRAIKDES